MSIQPSDITDEDLPEPRILTEEESREMKESLAQSNFGMSLAEFKKVGWQASSTTTASVTEGLLALR